MALDRPLRHMNTSAILEAIAAKESTTAVRRECRAGPE
jgi:hypothetical protein